MWSFQNYVCVHFGVWSMSLVRKHSSEYHSKRLFKQSRRFQQKFGRFCQFANTFCFVHFRLVRCNSLLRPKLLCDWLHSFEKNMVQKAQPWMSLDLWSLEKRVLEHPLLRPKSKRFFETVKSDKKIYVCRKHLKMSFWGLKSKPWEKMSKKDLITSVENAVFDRIKCIFYEHFSYVWASKTTFASNLSGAPIQNHLFLSQNTSVLRINEEFDVQTVFWTRKSWWQKFMSF